MTQSPHDQFAKNLLESLLSPFGEVHRNNALELFGNLRVTLETRQKINSEEQDLIMQLSPLYLEKIQAAELRGELRGELALVVKQLQRRFGSLSEEIKGKIMNLPVERLEALAVELLDFVAVEELIKWLEEC